MKETVYFPPEWYPQSAIMLTLPQKASDWCEVYDEVITCYKKLIDAIWPTQPVVVLVRDKKEAHELLFSSETLPANVRLHEVPTNDTWVRDYGAITVLKNEKPVWLDFQFNGWGLKFAADKDNRVNTLITLSGLLGKEVAYESHLDFVLEGGSIESDGAGTLMTTQHCLMAPNRNVGKTEKEIELFLKETFGVEQILWLHHGALEGDDTDGHIDTLARFCPNNTITYVKCNDPNDSHYRELHLMEQELRQFTNAEGEAYRLVPLPMPDPVYDEEGRRLPATYANFLIMNRAVLCPTYAQPEKDREAMNRLSELFEGKTIIGVDCRVLITQNGSLHCSTMQFPEGVF